MIGAGTHVQPYRVVIVGGGTAGWMAAAGLRRRLPVGQYDITLVESDEIGTVGVGEATLPHLRHFNDMLGLDEASFMAATGATFKLGIEFVGWEQPNASYIHPFGAFGEPWGGVQFQHHWLRARQAGLNATALQDYSYGVVSARAGAFDFPNDDQRSIRSTFSYAYHLDAGRYAALLREWATERGVRRTEGLVEQVEQHGSSGEITAIVLRSGDRIEGDLFVDCTGFNSLLLGGTMDARWQDWTHWLPCDRALALPCTRVDGLLPYTRATARRAGWTWRIPLQHRTGNGYVFSSAFAEVDEARETLLAALDGEPMGEPRLLRFAPGRREKAWVGNCVAIGLSSGFLEPLESTSIFLIQAAVSDLVALIPRPDSNLSDHRLADEFNRLFAMQYERVRDFLILHYVANARHGEPLWDYLRAVPMPESLQDKVALFKARGTAPDYQFGLFSRDSWLAVLVGQGIEASSYDPLANAMPLARLEQRLEELRSRVDLAIQLNTPHDLFVASYCPATAA